MGMAWQVGPNTGHDDTDCEEAGGARCAVGPEVCECCGKVWVETLRNITTVVLYSFFNREAYKKMAVVRLKDNSHLIETFIRCNLISSPLGGECQSVVKTNGNPN